jgi:hypothetical protein
MVRTQGNYFRFFLPQISLFSIWVGCWELYESPSPLRAGEKGWDEGVHSYFPHLPNPLSKTLRFDLSGLNVSVVKYLCIDLGVLGDLFFIVTGRFNGILIISA